MELPVMMESLMCDCGDCEFIWTDCCNVLRPLCETFTTNEEQHGDVITTCIGEFGCAGNEPDELCEALDMRDLFSRADIESMRLY